MRESTDALDSHERRVLCLLGMPQKVIDESLGKDGKEYKIHQLQWETRAPKLICNRSDLVLLKQDSSDELEVSREYDARATR